MYPAIEYTLRIDDYTPLFDLQLDEHFGVPYRRMIGEKPIVNKYVSAHPTVQRVWITFPTVLN